MSEIRLNNSNGQATVSSLQIAVDFETYYIFVVCVEEPDADVNS